MALETLEKLINGDSSIVGSYTRIKRKWDEILRDFDWNDRDAASKLSSKVTYHQIPMENLAGERWLGQEIMVIVGIGQFYNTNSGFNFETVKRAKIVRDAFLMSYCSLEVKSIAEEIGDLYEIDNYYSDFSFQS